MGNTELESRVQNINMYLTQPLTVVYPEGYDCDRIWLVEWLDGEPTDDRDENADIDIVAVDEYKDHSIESYLTWMESMIEHRANKPFKS